MTRWPKRCSMQGSSRFRPDRTASRSQTYDILSLMANNPGQNSQNKARRLEKLLAIQRLYGGAESDSSIVFSEIADTLRRMGNYAEAATRRREVDRHDTLKRSRSRFWLPWPIFIAGPATTRLSSPRFARP